MDVSQLLGHELILKVANNTKLEYIGYVEIVVRISDGVIFSNRRRS